MKRNRLAGEPLSILDQASIDALRAQAISPQQHLIGEAWVDASGGRARDIISPIDGGLLTTIAEGTAADVDAVVLAAKTAFEDGRWSRMAPVQRKQILQRFADLIQQNALELAVLGVRDNGTEIGMAIKAEPTDHPARKESIRAGHS